MNTALRDIERALAAADRWAQLVLVANWLHSLTGWAWPATVFRAKRDAAIERIDAAAKAMAAGDHQ